MVEEVTKAIEPLLDDVKYARAGRTKLAFVPMEEPAANAQQIQRDHAKMERIRQVLDRVLGQMLYIGDTHSL